MEVAKDGCQLPFRAGNPKRRCRLHTSVDALLKLAEGPIVDRSSGQNTDLQATIADNTGDLGALFQTGP